MTTENKLNLIDIEIPAGWTAFYNESTKTVTGYSEFPKGSKAKTALKTITKPTEDELLAAFRELGLKINK